MKADFMKKVLSLLMVFSIMAASFIIPVAFASSVNEETTISKEDEEKIENIRDQQAALEDKIKETEDKLNALKGDIAKQEAYVSELTGQIDNYQSKIDVLNKNISSLQGNINSVQSQINTLDKEIESIEADINHNQIETINTQQEIEDVYSDLKERLCEIYMYGSASTVEMLLGCENFSSFLILLELTSGIAENDSAMIDTLNDRIAQIAVLTEEYNLMIEDIEVKKDEHKKQIAVLEEKQSEIEASRSELQASQDKITDLQSTAMNKLDSLDKQSDAYKKLVKKYEDEQAAFDREIEQILANASHGSGNVETVEDGFIWPLQYSDAYISSYFGGRNDPITGKYKTHYAVDTCCWSGTLGKNVSAAASGTVITATRHSMYGYYVIIDHGNGIATLYAHNSKLLVSEGQKVKQGQTISYAGATGYVKGAHVHFEFRVNGQKVNPLNYVSLSSR